MTQKHCRWGIVGTANIAQKYWKAIRNAGNSTLGAVASRDRDRARQFIAKCQSSAPLGYEPQALGSYAELIRREDIDAVYLPLPTGLRKEWVQRAAEAGKHVLCEKPCGVTADDVREMLDACAKKHVQFMDGVMFMHSGRMELLRLVLDDPQSIGTIHRIASQFSFKGGEEFLASNIRASGELEPLGCLGDLGWYNIRYSLWVMRGRLPERVSGRILADHRRADSERSVPIEFAGELLWDDSASASFYCSFRTENQQWAVVSGTQGYVHIPDFVLPFFGSEVAFKVHRPVFRVDGCDFNMEHHTRRFAAQEYSNSTPNSQEANMIRNFAEIVLSGRLEPAWGEIALKTQQVIDACLQSARENGKVTRVADHETNAKNLNQK
jgi:predicted dehydrogenase